MLQRSFFLYLPLLPSLFLNLVLLIYASRYLDQNHFGIFYSIISLINICTIPITFIASIAQNNFSFTVNRSESENLKIHKSILEQIFVIYFFSALVLNVCLFLTDILFFDISIVWMITINAVGTSWDIEVTKSLYLASGKFWTCSLVTPVWLLLRFTTVALFLMASPKAINGGLGILFATFPILFYFFHDVFTFKVFNQITIRKFIQIYKKLSITSSKILSP